MHILKSLREKHRLTQGQLAKIVGVKRTTVTLWELGINKPRANTLLKLSSTLKCSVDDLLCSNDKSST